MKSMRPKSMHLKSMRPAAARLLPASVLTLLLAGCSILSSEQRDPVVIYAPQVKVPPIRPGQR